jgi:hypothetical protein
MHNEAEFWSPEDLETPAQQSAVDKAFTALLRQRMAAKRKRDDSRDNEKLRRNKRRLAR